MKKKGRKMNVYERSVKKRIVLARTIGLLTSAIGVASIFLYFFEIINPWFCVILLSYCMAMAFVLNSTFQEIRTGRIFCIVNLIFAFIFFVMTIFIIVYSFVTKGITIK